MRIGFTGGSTIFQLGEAEEVLRFFSRLREVSSARVGDVALVSDRLYRRYLRPEELAPAGFVIEQMVGILKPTMNASEFEFSERFVRGFQECCESAVVNFEMLRNHEGYVYEPVRLVPVDQPWCLAEMERSLDEYDSLVGTPFWAQAGQPL